MNSDMQVATAEASRRATVLRESCQRYRLALRQLQHRQRRASAGDASYSVHDATHQAAPHVSSDAAAANSRSRPRTASALAGITDDTFSSSSLQSDFAQACSVRDSPAVPRPATAGASSGAAIGDTQPQLSRALCKELAAYSALRTTYLKAVNTDSAVLATASSQARCAFMTALNPPPPQPPDADYLKWSPCAVYSCSEQRGGQASGNEEPCYTINKNANNNSDRTQCKNSSSSSSSASSSSSGGAIIRCAVDRSATAATAATIAATVAADVIDYKLLQQWVQDELCAVPSGGAAGAAAEGDARAARGRPSSAASLALLFKDW
jgi:hypothetical protein